MKSISKTRLPIEIYTFQEIMSTEEFRKKPLSSLEFSLLFLEFTSFTYK